MARFVRRFTKKIFILVTLLAVAVFLLACCNAFLNPGRFWYIAVLGVGFPFLTLVLVFFIFFWWVFRSRWALLPLAALVMGWPQVSAFFAIHPFSSFLEQKPQNAFRVMQWNVSSLGQMNRKPLRDVYRKKILEFVEQMNPDVLCMEEFMESNNPRELEQNIPYISGKLHYPYYYFARDHRGSYGLYDQGVAIFSRFPITDTLRLRYGTSDSRYHGESLIHTDIEVGGQRIRIFATHLQSLQFKGDDYAVLHTIAKGENEALNRSKGVLKKFRWGYFWRGQQAEIVRRELDDSPYPEMLCGDFNDVPNSYTYFRVRGDRNDAFIKKGFGIGRSFYSLSPTLRIDYILANKKLKVLQFKKTKLPYSDHYPLVADFALPGKE
jgi:endonuclease/exonuclease/phosphatase family metal-dependent hydrolase